MMKCGVDYLMGIRYYDQQRIKLASTRHGNSESITLGIWGWVLATYPRYHSGVERCREARKTFRKQVEGVGLNGCVDVLGAGNFNGIMKESENRGVHKSKKRIRIHGYDWH